nr:DUF5110 domain-containing protein [Amylolactobacillus amylophilus]
MKKSDTSYDGEFLSGEKLRISWLSEQILRVQITTGELQDYPIPDEPAHTARMTVLPVEGPAEVFKASELLDTAENYRIRFGRYTLIYKKDPAVMALYDEAKSRFILRQVLPVSLTQTTSTEVLHQDTNEFYFGGGTQNGHFSHKGHKIKVANTNVWTDGGVSSPNPFFWSNSGFGLLRNTWRPGLYDFGTNRKNQTGITHKDPTFDNIYLLGDSPAEILKHYYELTGQPILLPKFGFYEAHLNAYNRDIWVQSDSKNAIEFEDGATYEEYLPQKVAADKGIKESLNGEHDNYQFSARAVIDRYQKHDIPLGWFIPNDGYGAGYGQTDTFKGDLNNLEAFANYANKHGVALGLWAQSNLHPVDPANPQKGERDLNAEIKQANLAALKTDVAWVGAGYSFGLNALQDATVLSLQLQPARLGLLASRLMAGLARSVMAPFGPVTRSVASGNTSASRFRHTSVQVSRVSQTLAQTWMVSMAAVIPRSMCATTSGRPSPLSNSTWMVGEPTARILSLLAKKATQINRAYLKLKSQMLPYTYSLAHEALTGKPMIRAMFLEFPHEKINYTKLVQYQYMWGPNFLVAPIYTAEQNNAGNSLRHNVYLPDAHQMWVDFFTGEKYMGGTTVDNLVYAHWHTPLFVKAGAIVPLTRANNNPNEIDRTNRIFNFYPAGRSTFTLIDDDGKSTDYLEGAVAKTELESTLVGTELTIDIHKTTGSYDGFAKEQSTLLNILCDRHPGEVTVTLNGQEIDLPEVDNRLSFDQAEMGYMYCAEFSPSEYFDLFSSKVKQQHALQIKLPPLDITKYALSVDVKNLTYGAKTSSAQIIDSAMRVPRNFAVDLAQTGPTSLHLVWQQPEQIDSFEILVNGQRHVNIKGSDFTVTELDFDTVYSFKIRSKRLNKVSEWSEQIKGKTSADPLTNVIKGIKASSNVFDQPEREIKYLVDQNLTTEWSTDPETALADPDNGQFTELTFEFDQQYQLDHLEYVPRTVTQLGELEEIALSFSTDGQNWSTFGAPITFSDDEKAKVVPLNGTRTKAIKLRVLKSKGDLAAGRELFFYHL